MKSYKNILRCIISLKNIKFNMRTTLVVRIYSAYNMVEITRIIVFCA